MAYSKIQFRNQSCDLIYIDVSAGGGGDGITPATAYNTLPNQASLAANSFYLIRRNATTELTWTVGTNTNDHVHLIGMPKSTDLYYHLVPTAAQTAWGADSADYARLKLSSSTGTIAFGSGTGGAYCSMFRLDVRTTNDTNLTDAYQLVAYAAFWMEKCWWHVDGYDMSTVNTVYISTRARSGGIATLVTATDHNLVNGTVVTIANMSSAGYNLANATITVTNSTTFTYSNAGGDESTIAETTGMVTGEPQGRRAGFDINGGYYVFKDNICEFPAKGVDNSAATNNLIDFQGGQARVTGNTIYFGTSYGSSNTQRSGMIFSAGANYSDIKDNIVYQIMAYRVSTNYYITCSKIFELPTARYCNIINNTFAISSRFLANAATKTTLWNGTYNAVSITGSGNTIKQLTVDTSYVPFMGTITDTYGGLFITQFDTSSTENIRAEERPVFIDGVTVNYSQYHAATTYAFRIQVNGWSVVQNINVDAKNSVAFDFSTLYGSGSPLYYGAGSVMGTNYFKGKIIVQNCKVFQAEQIETSKVQETPLTFSGGTRAYINKIICPEAQINTAYKTISAAHESQVAINDIDVEPLNMTIFTFADTAEVHIIKTNSKEGQFLAENIDYTCYSTNAYRTGGANYTVRLTQKVTSPTKGLLLGPLDFPTFTLIPTSTGHKMIYMYWNYSTYTSYTTANMILMAEVPNGISPNYVTYISTTTGIIDTDASTWNNVSGTARVTKMLIDVQRLEPIKIHVRFNWGYTSAYTAYAYLDPKIVITDAP